jgi:hypothetical protein
MSLRGTLHFSLDEIRLEGETATEQAIQESLDHWRKFIALVEINLPRLEEDLEKFTRFAYPEKIPRRVRAIVDEVTIHIDNAIDQAATLESTLQADMSVIESRRGIAEAASVTKITELAFIFTPDILRQPVQHANQGGERRYATTHLHFIRSLGGGSIV